MAYTLDGIITCLNERRVRATYGAVAGVLGPGFVAKALMKDRERNAENSWVVHKDTKLPLDYSDEELAPRLANTVVIMTADKLRDWLVRINCPQA